MFVMRWISMIAALLVMTISPAWAHAGLVSSDPADGSVLTIAPTQVVLEFNEVLLEDTVSVALRDAQDVVVSSGEVRADGAVVTAPWPAGLPDGQYRLAYRVVSADGHPVNGEIGIVLNSRGNPDIVPAPAAAPAGLPTWLIGVLAIALLATVGLFVMARRARR
jgi:methionine-rich copper-binding protein CopC